MAPLTVASANLAYDRAITKLKRACTELELNIPPCDAEGAEAAHIPPLRPRERSEAVTPCALCCPEREQLDDEARANHVCTHRGQGTDGVRAAGSEGERNDGSSSYSLRKRLPMQPKMGVVKEYFAKLKTCLDAFTDAV